MSFDKPTAICGETRAFICISQKSDNAFSASTISRIPSFSCGKGSSISELKNRLRLE
jgi:hypothetical protein